MASQRAQFATKAGVIATTVGSAVGLGNIWRFPFEAGTHGGAAFILIYIICVFAIGVPVICSEFVIGRGTHKNVHGAFKILQSSPAWGYFSFIGIIASLMILCFYSVVAGWTLSYFFEALSGNMTDGNLHNFTEEFNAFTASPVKSTLCTVAFLFINYLIVVRGVKKGIEKISNIVMPFLAIILVILLVDALFLPNADKGLEFMFKPDFSKITPSVFLGAMGQAFFSLSLGLSCLLTYSSYFKDDTPLVKNAMTIAVLDTFVAIVSGIIVFSAVFSFGAEPAAGPKLVFDVLPGIFNAMPGGYFWAVLFFLLLIFASITSTISMSEISIAYFSEEWGFSRKNATKLCTAIAVIFGILCTLSFGVLSDFKIFGKTLFDLFDYMSSNVLLPLGGIVFSIFVGWSAKKSFVYNQLTNHGTRCLSSYKIILFLIRYIAPTSIILITLYVLGII